MATIWLNGKIVSSAEAKVSAFDAGFTHAVGLFETMLGGCSSSGPWAAMLHEHMMRLAESASDLGLAEQINTTALADAVMEAIEASGLERARVRLTLSGGDLNMLGRSWERARSAADGRPTETGAEPTILIVAQEATKYPAEMFERGVAVTIADTRANPLDPLAGHKTLSYWGRLRDLRNAGAKGAAEAIVLQVTNHLAGGCVSNAILVQDGRLVTPVARGEEERGTLPSPVLPGTVRAWALEWAGERSIPVERRPVTIEEILAADEVMLTNSSWGVLPVVKIEREAVGDGVPGRLSGELVKAWAEKVEDEAGM